LADIDTHPVHQVYLEVNTGSQSLGFTPNVYAAIKAVREIKKAALLQMQPGRLLRES
jgi:hypothetical protein